MSIEQKIAEILAESNKDETQIEATEIETEALAENAEDDVEIVAEGEMPPALKKAIAKKNGDDEDEEDDEEDDSDDSDEDEVVMKKESKKMKKEEVETESNAIDVKEDVAALVNGEDLSEEFKTKAATIFEAAIVTRVKSEVARLEEEFAAKLEEATADNKEGLVEKVDGYLNYVVEQWINNNEIALENGMKSEILEGFVSGLKGLFEEHYIDIPEEKFDVLGSLEQDKADLEEKLNEQLAANVELNKVINESARKEILSVTASNMTETEKEKFFGLAEELSFEDAETFEKKVQTIRENYFTGKTSTTNVNSVVTDEPIETIKEEVKLNGSMSQYVNTLNYLK